MSLPVKIEPFSGPPQSITRWLRQFQYEITTGCGKPDNYQVPAPEWLEAIDRHLSGEAAKWADRHPTIKLLLRDDRIDRATQDDVAKFRRLITDRFATKSVPEEPDPRLCLNKLAQGKNESLYAYYRRTADLFLAVGGRDCDPDAIGDMDQLVKVVRDLTIEKFIEGLQDYNLIIRLLRYMNGPY